MPPFPLTFKSLFKWAQIASSLPHLPSSLYYLVFHLPPIYRGISGRFVFLDNNYPGLQAQWVGKRDKKPSITLLIDNSMCNTVVFSLVYCTVPISLLSFRLEHLFLPQCMGHLNEHHRDSRYKSRHCLPCLNFLLFFASFSL